MIRIVLLLFVVSLTYSCGRTLPELENFDEQSWKKDKNGCMNLRASMKSTITAQKSKLLALNEMEIVTLLGKPDQNELSKRNQKFYYYFLSPSKDCGLENASAPSKLVIRFNAMGLAKEIDVQ